MSFNSKDWKGFTFRSGPAKSTKQNYSTFWDNQVDDVDVDDFLGLDTDVKKGKDFLIICNGINIVKRPNITSYPTTNLYEITGKKLSYKKIADSLKLNFEKKFSNFFKKKN